MPDFINLTEENIAGEHLCCIIRSKKPHPGVECKRAWLTERLKEGHVFRKLDAKGCCFIEYAPVDQAWVPVVGSRFYYVYCLWVNAEFKGHGYGKQLMEYCIADAKAHSMSGLCMLGAKRQKNWLSNQSFAQKYGFVPVDETADGYQLLALSFDGSKPSFTDKARMQHIDDPRLTIYYTAQCPFIPQKVQEISAYCTENSVPLNLVAVDTLEKAKDLPCVMNNFGAFYQGQFVTVNLLDQVSIAKLTSR